MVSFSCTSPSLSDKTNHPYFLRGVPPDTAQGRALADLLEYFEFDGLDIAAISTADEYGARGIEVRLNNITFNISFKIFTIIFFFL